MARTLRLRPSHLRRYREIAGVLFDEGFEYLAVQAGFARFTVRRHRRAEAETRSVEERARRVLERLGPTYVKIGQMLSTRPDLLPPEFITELSRLQDDVPPFPFEQARAVIESELEQPLEEIYAAFDPVPIAAASIGQVHAAVLRDGREVVVKVQRPGIVEVMQSDFDIIHTQAAFAERATLWGRRYNLIEVAEELERILSAELDYLREARSAQRFAESFAAYPGVRVPAVDWERTTRRVITLERLHGIKLDDITELVAAGFDAREIARTGVEAYFKQMFEDGFFHADPHPGNLIVTLDGDIGFTDFGRMGSIPLRTRIQFSDLFLALIDRDERETVDLLLDIGIATRDTDQKGLEAAINRMYTRYFDAPLGNLRISALAYELMRVVYESRLRIPPDFTLLISTFSTLEGVAVKLDPELNLIESARPYAARIVRERFAPANIGQGFMRSLRHVNRLLVDLPESLNRVMRRAADGELGAEVRLEGFDRLLEQLREMVNRIAFAVVIAAFVVGFSLILREVDLPVWFLWVCGVMLLGAASIGVWFFLSIFLSMWRARH